MMILKPMSDDADDFLKTMQELSSIMKEARLKYEVDNNAWWNNLSYDDKCRAFYAVVKRIHEGEILKNHSYRGVLYDTFGFGMEMYGLGMECGYLDLHNSIYTSKELKKLSEKN
jgi:hypothetical protein